MKLQPNDAFVWTQEPWGDGLRCVAIDTPHVFSTRSLELRDPARQQSGWETLASALDVLPPDLVRPKQVHGSAVVVVGENDQEKASSTICGEADIIVSQQPDTAVAVQTADCVPILLFDPRTGAAGAAHSGWKGTAADVAGKAVAAMVRSFNSRPADLIAAIGPSIGPCCYQVGEDLLQVFGAAGRRWFFRFGPELRLNLWAANRDQLAEAGLDPANIHVAELCTAMEPALFHSYRRDREAAGRLASAIRTRTFSTT